MKLLLAIVVAAAAVAVAERGEEVKLGGPNTYTSCAATATAVILVSDIFGYTLPRLREIADKVYRVGKGLPFNLDQLVLREIADKVYKVGKGLPFNLGQLVLREIADKVYRVGKGLPFNLGKLVFDAVIKAAFDSEDPLLYPNIIFQILVKQAASDSEGPLLYPNIIFQILVKQGCSAKASSDCVLPPVLIFSKTLYTSDRFKDLPYTSSVSSDDEDSTFEAIRNYMDSEAGDVGPSSASNILAVQKVLSDLPGLIKKAEVLLHSLKDAQGILRKVVPSPISEDEG